MNTDTIHGRKPHRHKSAHPSAFGWASETVDDTGIVLTRYEGWRIADRVTTGDPAVATAVVAMWKATGQVRD